MLIHSHTLSFLYRVEFDGCWEVNVDAMVSGKCVMTYNWGDSFTRYLDPGTKLRGRYGVAATPGSKRVLDRKTMKLVDCTADLCKHGTYYEDIGWVNKAPYLAYGGWACAVNNYTTDVKKRLASEFCQFASSKEESIKVVIPNATGSYTNKGRDPFRTSHLDLDLYKDQGYESDTTVQYIETIRESLDSPNIVTDIRFPTSAEIYAVLDQEIHDYLNSTKHGLVSEAERPAKRRQVSESITKRWEEIISTYNDRGSTNVPLLETYQRLRNIHSPNVNLNQLGSIRGYGIALASIVIICSLVFGLWTLKYKKNPVVRASQPFFLAIICFGTVVLGSAIFPLGIDDSFASDKTCSRACMSVPWLLALGWSIVFSALYSKLRRVNLIINSAKKFRRLKLSEKDVLLPFVLLFSSNFVLLLIWTLVDPLYWDRVMISETESYGTCTADLDSSTWKITLSLIAALNGVSLILANVEAYKARNIDTEYGESKYIDMIMGSILQVVLVGMPLLFLVNENAVASYYIRSTIIFVVCMSILIFIFGPNIMVWHYSKRNDRVKRNDFTMSTTSEASSACGLQYTRRASLTDAVANTVKLEQYTAKIARLELILTEQGVDVKSMFREAGTGDTSNEHISSLFLSPASSFE